MTKEELMKKWIPTIVTLVLTIAGMLTPQIQAALAHHPEYAMLVAGVYAILKGLAPSPVADQPKQG